MKNILTWFLKQTRAARFELLLLIVFFTAFSLGQLGRVSITPTITLYSHDLVIGIWLLFHLRSLLSIIWQSLRWVTQHPLVLATVLWVLAGLTWASLQQLQLRPLLVLTRLLTYLLFAASISEFVGARRVVLRAVLILVGNAMLWLGLLQYLWLPDTRFLSILGWDDHYFRLIGPLFDPNFMGMLIVLVIVFTASIDRFLPKKAQLLLQAYYAALLAVTFSRASYATAGMTAFLLLSTPAPLRNWRMGQRLILLVVTVIVFSVVLFVAPKPGGEGVKLLRTSSIEARQQTATQTFQNLSAIDLVLGKGLFANPLPPTTNGAASVVNHAQVPDNIILLLLAGTGIFGTILILSTAVYWIGQLAAKETALAIAVAVTLLHAQFNNTLFEPFISLYLLLAVLSPLDRYQISATAKKRFRAKKKRQVS